METLATKYRPKSFRAMVGQDINSVILDKLVEKDAVPQALLFHGPKGTGKTSAARILAMELNPGERNQILLGESVSVVEIDSASNGSVADIRNLIESLRYSSGAEYRVIILDEAHSITREGFNALLKVLEEPPLNVIFVLVTTEPHKIPDTVLSRLVSFQFSKVSASDILDRISAIASREEIQIDSDLLVLLSSRADGSVRDALMELDLVRRAGISTSEEFRNLSGDTDCVPLLLEAANTGNHAELFAELNKQLQSVSSPKTISDELTSCLRDILVLQSNGTLDLDGDLLEARLSLAKKIDGERIISAIKILWDSKTKIRVSDNPRGSLELALVLISDVFTRGKAAAPKAVATSNVPPATVEPVTPRRLTIAEMQQML